MKNLLTKYLMLMLSAVVIAACSDDNDPIPMNPPNTSGTPFSLGVFDETSIVSVPTGMIQSGDAHASVVASYVVATNGFLLFGAFFTPPAGLEPSTKKISATNGRTAADYTVYEWSDGGGNAIAYQYSFQNSKHVVEVFIKSEGNDYLKFIQAEQDESGNQGTMRFLDVDGADPSSVALVYTWSIAADGTRKIVMEDSQGSIKVEINSNSNLSGDMNLFEGGILVGHFAWDGAGNGSWIEYNPDGSIADQGSWTV